jgi:hypothetical protein
MLFVNKGDCSIRYNLNNVTSLPDTFLKGYPVNKVFIDREGELWFLTAGMGAFKLANKATFNFVNKTGTLNSNFNYIKKEKNFFSFANAFGEILNTSNDFSKVIISNDLFKKYNDFKIVDIFKVNGKNLFFTSKGAFTENKNIIPFSIKDISRINDSTILVASPVGVSTINYNKLNINENDIQNFGLNSIWKERATAVLYTTDSVFVGSLNGLFVVRKDTSNYSLSKINKIFERRISAIKKAADNTIWVATYDAGIIAYKNGKILQIFNDSNGLTSNICRNLYINGNYAWVGTDKGLNKIDISKQPYKIVINYTTTDGLASNMINAVYTDSNMVYVGTPEGLTYFDETKIVNNSTCDMRILSITNSGKEQQWDSSKIFLANKDNNIRIDFVAISFKAAGDIEYAYRLVGLNDEWKTTRENYISYPSLPSGNYTFEVKAVNKFGQKSELIKVDFEIEKLLTEKIWFRILLLLLSLGAIYFYFNRRINKLKREALEKEAIADKVNDMEQMALKAQMNPHFIFNCLNSIQEYVINSDVKGANKFISDFSKLIRSTLDNSSKKVISIEDEIKYLTNYLRLEQYRFENKFEFNIFTNKELNMADTYIPPMLLQPYLENAIRHGINNKKGGQGLIQINMLKVYKNLVCEIIDNGIGIAAATKLKGTNHIEYQSKGMALTAKRIQLLNKNIEQDILVQIEDITHPETGTKVTIIIPI